MLTWRWVKCLPSQVNGPSCEVKVLPIRSIASQKRSRTPIGLALPEAISVPPRFDKADLEPPARDHIGGRIFLGHPHRILAHRDQRPHAEEADVAGLPRDDAEDDRARAIKAVDAGVVLARGDVEAELVAKQILVERFLEQLRRNLGVAIFVGRLART